MSARASRAFLVKVEVIQSPFGGPLKPVPRDGEEGRFETSLVQAGDGRVVVGPLTAGVDDAQRAVSLHSDTQIEVTDSAFE